MIIKVQGLGFKVPGSRLIELIGLIKGKKVRN
jgi:hypothetical protein